MIFISGVHAVGKGYFCNMVKDKLGIQSYSASTLISEKKHAGFNPDKLIPDIDDNQRYLLAAVDELRKSEKNFILDGHFCLLNVNGEVTRISLPTFTTLNPEAIILLTEDPEIIARRRKERDGKIVSPQSIEKFQSEETAYAKEVSGLIGARLFISHGAQGLASAIDFIKSF